MINDKTKLVKEAKNDEASRCCWSAYQKRLGKMGLGEMRLGEILIGWDGSAIARGHYI